MAHLTDMEELLGRIIRPEAKDYMREALACYHAGAYRACIVLSCSALFEDLAEKLRLLAEIDGEAGKLHRKIQKQRDDHKTFETDLRTGLLGAGITSKAEDQTLEDLLRKRNQAAHPSGVHAPAEAARYVFHAAIDGWLSRPQLTTREGVQRLMQRLEGSHFFTSPAPADRARIAAEELALLHPRSWPLLVGALIAALESHGPALYDAAGGAAANQAAFLLGLAAQREEPLRTELRRRLIAQKAHESDFAPLILDAATADPQLVEGQGDTTVERLRALMESTDAPRAHALFAALLTAHGEDWLEAHFPALAAMVVAALRRDGPALEALKDAPGLRGRWIAVLTGKAGSDRFDAANAAARTIQRLQGPLGALLSDRQAFALLHAVSAAAGFGAFDAQDLSADGFADLPVLRAKALAFAETEAEAAAQMLREAGEEEDLATWIDRALRPAA